MIPKSLNINETAAALGLSVASVRKQLYESRRGESDLPLPFTGFKKKAFWLESEIASYINRRNSVANPPGRHKESILSSETQARAERLGLVSQNMQ